MTHSTAVDIQIGWKVFAGSEEVGEIVAIGADDIEVQRGFLVKHTYRIPRAHVAEAGDGVVDLDVNRAAVDDFAISQDDPAGHAGIEDLPEEYRRIEYGTEDSLPRDDPFDLRRFPR